MTFGRRFRAERCRDARRVDAPAWSHLGAASRDGHFPNGFVANPWFSGLAFGKPRVVLNRFCASPGPGMSLGARGTGTSRPWSDQGAMVLADSPAGSADGAASHMKTSGLYAWRRRL